MMSRRDGALRRLCGCGDRIRRRFGKDYSFGGGENFTHFRGPHTESESGVDETLNNVRIPRKGRVVKGGVKLYYTDSDPH